MRGGGTPRRTPEQDAPQQDAPPGALPSYRHATFVWLKIGLLSFGGPAGQIAMLHREVVEQRHWVSERRFLHALSFCALLPGPEAQQLATYLGWLMHGARGGVTAGTLFVLPGALVLLVLSAIYAQFGQVPAVEGLFFGLKSAVLAVVLQALTRFATRALTTPAAWLVASFSVVSLSAFGQPLPAIIGLAAATGLVLPRHFQDARFAGELGSQGLVDRVFATDPALSSARARAAWSAAAGAVAAWALPISALTWLAPGRFSQIAWFFSKAAVVTFGGAYAVLAYVAQDAVHAQHWLNPGEMLSGLGLAETTPGPLVLVLEFVGFIAGFRAPGSLTGLLGGLAGSGVTLWVTFLPCFAFVFLGAPIMEGLAENRTLSAALSAVMAAIVGVIAHLALWFGMHVLFNGTIMLHAGMVALEMPEPTTFDAYACSLAGLAGALLFGLKQAPIRVLAICAFAGILITQLR